MLKVRTRINLLIAFLVLIFAIVSAYFLISIELSNIPTTTTTTLRGTTTLHTTSMPPTTSTTTTTLPPSLRERLLELANENIQGKCNVTYTSVDRKHFPTSKWFYELCPNFIDYNETEKWRTDAYLNDECDIEKEYGCIEIFTSISLDEKLLCVWGINHFNASRINFGNLTQKYC